MKLLPIDQGSNNHLLLLEFRKRILVDFFLLNLSKQNSHLTSNLSLDLSEIKRDNILQNTKQQHEEYICIHK